MAADASSCHCLSSLALNCGSSSIKARLFALPSSSSSSSSDSDLEQAAKLSASGIGAGGGKEVELELVWTGKDEPETRTEDGDAECESFLTHSLAQKQRGGQDWEPGVGQWASDSSAQEGNDHLYLGEEDRQEQLVAQRSRAIFANLRRPPSPRFTRNTSDCLHHPRRPLIFSHLAQAASLNLLTISHQLLYNRLRCPVLTPLPPHLLRLAPA